MKVKIANARKKKVEITYEERPALYATSCDGCSEIFKMLPWCNDTGLGELTGTFDKCAGSGGNSFSASVCSFYCANKVFAKSGWCDMPKYKEFAEDGATLVRASLKITAHVLTEKGAKKWWKENAPTVEIDKEGHRTVRHGMGSILGLMPCVREPATDDPERWADHILNLAQSRLTEEHRATLIAKLHRIETEKTE